VKTLRLCVKLNEKPEYVSVGLVGAGFPLGGIFNKWVAESQLVQKREWLGGLRQRVGIVCGIAVDFYGAA